MSNGSRVESAESAKGVMVSFGDRLQASDRFDQVFREGMALVERAAAYLDGPGRRESKSLKSPMTVLYATESMRLTTRLLDLASWLLIRRGLRAGEITPAEAQRKRQRVKLQSLGRPSHVKGFAELPEGLRGLITESFALQDRIVQLDKSYQLPAEGQGAQIIPLNPVGQQVALLQRAFGGNS
jgi:regulator of CtrA degradation